MTHRIRHLLAAVAATALALPALAQEPLTAEIRAVTVDGEGDAVGVVAFSDSEHGLLIEPALEGLAPGVYGLHVHQNADCGPGEDAQGQTIAAGAAGGHLDPEETGRHEGPYGDGHLGDLPNLVVWDDGTADLPLLAPRLATLSATPS